MLTGFPAAQPARSRQSTKDRSHQPALIRFAQQFVTKALRRQSSSQSSAIQSLYNRFIVDLLDRIRNRRDQDRRTIRLRRRNHGIDLFNSHKRSNTIVHRNDLRRRGPDRHQPTLHRIGPRRSTGNNTRQLSASRISPPAKGSPQTLLRAEQRSLRQYCHTAQTL